MIRPYRRQADSERPEHKNNGPGQGFEAVVPNPKLKLMDQVREVMLRKKLKHRNAETLKWKRGNWEFTRMKSREELTPSEAKVEGFRTDLAVKGKGV
jgi:hypothetical protein